jgi:exosome complex component RRP4
MVDVTCKGPNLRKLDGGLIEQVNPSKVPRIIGKRGSMVSLIKKHTGCDITVGQNGYIWVKGKPAMERVALQAMKKIAKNSHKSGLTDTIETYLKQATGDQS